VLGGAYLNSGLIVPPRKRPGRPLLEGEEEDYAEHRKVRARVEHVIGRMKNYKILRDCRQRGEGPPSRRPGRRPHAQPDPRRMARHANSPAQAACSELVQHALGGPSWATPSGF
jgi:hypothetical protein